MALSQTTPSRRKWLLTLGAYTGTAALSIALVCYALELWRADLRIPFSYGTNDELIAAVGAK